MSKRIDELWETKDKKKLLWIESGHGITKEMVNKKLSKSGMKFRVRVKIPNIKKEKYLFVATMEQAKDVVRKMNAKLIEVKEINQI